MFLQWFMSSLSSNLQHYYFQHLSFTFKRFDANFLSNNHNWEFHIDMLQQNSTQSNKLHSFMYHYSIETKITTMYGSHVAHIWTNAPSQQYTFGVVEAY